MLPAPITNTGFTAQRVVSAPVTGAGAQHAIVPAGLFSTPPSAGAGKALLIKGAGTLANQATGATFAPVLALDTTAGTLLAGGTIFTLPAITPTASVVVPFNFEILVTCQAVGVGATALQCNGEWRHSVAATSTAPVATNLNTHISTALTALNSEAPMYLDLFCTSTVGTTNSIILQQLLMFGLN